MMPLWEKVSQSCLRSTEAFRKVLKTALKELGVDAKRFSEISGISESSLYKILSGERANPRLSTYRKIIQTIRQLEEIEEAEEVEPFVAVIAARPSLDAIEKRYIAIKGRQIQLKEYAATSIEDVIVEAIRAQQEGAKAIVCAPIVSTTVERISKVPVCACPVALCRYPLLKAAEKAASKILLE